MPERISERDLILPALWCMSQPQDGPISTSELMVRLREILRPTGEDLEILAGRKDDKFSQKVRNLRSHETLEKLGFATYEQRARNSYWTITPTGKEYLDQNYSFLRYILTHQFSYQETRKALAKVDLPTGTATTKKRKLAAFDENCVINEGMKVSVEHNVYIRSAKLRSAAIKYYSKGGHIVCHACSFDFAATYGELGKDFIEIHHVKPVYAYEDSDLNVVIKEALKNVVPLCSNCHRIIHRRRKQTLVVSELADLVKSRRK